MRHSAKSRLTYPGTRWGRRRYRKLKRQANKTGKSIEKYCQDLLWQRRYERVWPKLKPGALVRIYGFQVCEVLYRMGSKHVRIKPVGFVNKVISANPGISLKGVTKVSYKQILPYTGEVLSRLQHADLAKKHISRCGLPDTMAERWTRWSFENA